MKFVSWPRPPMQNTRTPPEIPERFKMFGLEYKTVDGNPCLDMPAKPLDKRHMRECIDKSLGLFLDTIRTFDGSMLNQIRDLHIHMNEEISMALAFEGFDIIRECRKDKAKIKAGILDDIRRVIE